MNYLKKIFESNKKSESELAEMAKVLFIYFNEFEYDASKSDLEEKIRTYVDMDVYYDYTLTIPIIKTALTNAFNNMYNHTADVFIETYDQIKYEVERMPIHTSEIEDLFLDMDKVRVQKSASHDRIFFKIEIPKVDNKKVTKVFNRIWNVVSQRLPEDYKISNLQISKYNDGLNSSIEVMISPPYKLYE